MFFHISKYTFKYEQTIPNGSFIVFTVSQPKFNYNSNNIIFSNITRNWLNFNWRYNFYQLVEPRHSTIFWCKTIEFHIKLWTFVRKGESRFWMFNSNHILLSSRNFPLYELLELRFMNHFQYSFIIQCEDMFPRNL